MVTMSGSPEGVWDVVLVEQAESKFTRVYDSVEVTDHWLERGEEGKQPRHGSPNEGHVLAAASPSFVALLLLTLSSGSDLDFVFSCYLRSRRSKMSVTTPSSERLCHRI